MGYYANDTSQGYKTTARAGEKLLPCYCSETKAGAKLGLGLGLGLAIGLGLGLGLVLGLAIGLGLGARARASYRASYRARVRASYRARVRASYRARVRASYRARVRASYRARARVRARVRVRASYRARARARTRAYLRSFIIRVVAHMLVLLLREAMAVTLVSVSSSRTFLLSSVEVKNMKLPSRAGRVWVLILYLQVNNKLFSIPVNRPYLGGTVPLLLPLSHHPTFTPFCLTFLNPLQLTTK